MLINVAISYKFVFFFSLSLSPFLLLFISLHLRADSLYILIFPRRRNAEWSYRSLNLHSMCNDSSLRFRSEDLDGTISVLRVGTHCSSSLLDHLSSCLFSRLTRLFIRLAIRRRFRFVDRYDPSFTILLRGWCGFLVLYDLHKMLTI